MHKAAAGVVDRLLAGEELAKQWRQNEDYTEEARARAVAAARQAARDEAVRYAKAELQGARSRTKAAKEAHAKALGAALQALDPARQLLVAERAKAAGGDVERLLSIAREALTTLDYGQLVAVRDFVLPALRANIGRQYGGGFSKPTFNPGDYGGVEREVTETLRSVEPPELFGASLELKAAEEDLRQMQAGLKAVNDRIANTTGGAGPLADVLAGPVGVLSGSVESGRVVIGRLPSEE